VTVTSAAGADAGAVLATGTVESGDPGCGEVGGFGYRLTDFVPTGRPVVFGLTFGARTDVVATYTVIVLPEGAEQFSLIASSRTEYERVASAVGLATPVDEVVINGFVFDCLGSLVQNAGVIFPSAPDAVVLIDTAQGLVADGVTGVNGSFVAGGFVTGTTIDVVAYGRDPSCGADCDRCAVIGSLPLPIPAGPATVFPFVRP
jgi:hypothetical protein